MADDAAELAADHGGGHRRLPHESPWVMTLPLVVLAFFAAFGGLLDLPFGNLDFLEQWLDGAPFIEETEHISTKSDALSLLLVGCTFVAVMIGIFLAWLVYSRHRLKAVEPDILEHGWYVDDGVSWVVAKPGRESWDGVVWFDENIVDGAVMGSGELSKRVGRGLRRYESGFVRAYAVGIGIGAVVLLGWFLLAGVL